MGVAGFLTRFAGSLVGNLLAGCVTTEASLWALSFRAWGWILDLGVRIWEVSNSGLPKLALPVY